MTSVDASAVAASSSPAFSRPGIAKRLLRRPLAMAAVVFLALTIVACLLAPWVAPYGPQDNDLLNALSGPSAAHPLGTDSLGRDVLSRLLWGGQPALGPVVAAILVALLIGVPVGLASVMSDRVDRVIRPIVDLTMSIPGIIVLFMVLATFNQNMYAAMIGMGVMTSPNLVRIVRAGGLTVVSEPYVEAARVYGIGSLGMAWRHVLPRVTGPILVNTSLLAAGALLAEAGINFLGLGVHPPQPSWGGMIADAATSMTRQPWLLVPSGGLVALVVVALILIGDGVRDAAAEAWSATGGGASRRRRKTRNSEEQPSSQPAATEGDDGVLLRVRGLTVEFPQADGRGFTVVDDVSFDVRRGETVGVVGESGCGKTMTGLAILGLLPDGAETRGSVMVAGVDLLRLSEAGMRRRRGKTIAFVSQDPISSLDPLFTVGFQLAQAVRVHQRVSRAESYRQALRLLEQVRIAGAERVLRLYPHQISGGMAQRVAIAIALAGRPDILIADEPTTALDATVQAEVLTLLRTLQDELGMAVLLISHDWGVVGEICERAVVMYAGQVIERARTEEIFARPLHPYSHGLLGANPHFAEPGQRLATIPGTVPAPRDWPAGCRFKARCAFATEDCGASIPMARPDDGRESRCIHIDRLLELEASNV